MGFRENDFWLWDVALLQRIVAEATAGRRHLLQAFTEGGLTTELTVYYSWLAQKIRDGEVDSHVLISPSDGLATLRNCTAHHPLPAEGYFYEERNGAQCIEAHCLGRYWNQIGQAALWGCAVHPSPCRGKNLFQNNMSRRLWRRERLSEFVQHVPWCTSNCALLQNV